MLVQHFLTAGATQYYTLLQLPTFPVCAYIYVALTAEMAVTA
jgi:hypothetical protein